MKNYENHSIRRWALLLGSMCIVLSGSSFADGNEDEDKPVEREATPLPINEAKKVIDIVGDIFSSDEEDDRPQRASLTFEVRDWAGRPTNARINLVGERGSRYSRATVAGRAVIYVDTIGTYLASLEVNPTRGRAGPARTVTVSRLNQRDRYVLRILKNTPQQLATSGRVSGLASSVNELPRQVDSPIKFTAAPPAPYYDPPGDNFGRGKRLSLQGEVRDRQGRPIEALVVISLRDEPIGHARTVAGRFSLFDLAHGEFELVAMLPPDRRGLPQRITIDNHRPRIVLIVER